MIVPKAYSIRNLSSPLAWQQHLLHLSYCSYDIANKITPDKYQQQQQKNNLANSINILLCGKQENKQQ